MGKHPARKRPGRAGHPDGFYERIAAEYLAALEPKPIASLDDVIASPNDVIAAAHFVSTSTVRGWVAKCRKLGLLKPAQRGRPKGR